jgi:hypothetical protein
MILSTILLVITAAVLYGIYVVTGRAVNGVPLAVVGIILLLIFLGVAFYLFGGIKSIKVSNSEPGMFMYRTVHAFRPIDPDRKICCVIFEKPSSSI